MSSYKFKITLKATFRKIIKSGAKSLLIEYYQKPSCIEDATAFFTDTSRFSLQTQTFSSETSDFLWMDQAYCRGTWNLHWRPQGYHQRSKLLINDPKIWFQTRSFHRRPPAFNQRPQNFVWDPRFSLETSIFYLKPNALQYNFKIKIWGY